MAVAASPMAIRAWQVVPVVGLLVLAATWGRDIGLPVVVLVAILLAGGVLAAVHHAEVVAHRVGSRSVRWSWRSRSRSSRSP